MGILSRTIFREIASSAFLGALMFIFVLFLQKAGQLFTILVSATTSPETVGYLFLLLLPATMPLTLPLGVLVGTLIGLSRMSSDGEITALRAAGVPARRVTLPVTAFALVAMSITGYCSLQLTPWCQAEMIRVINQMGAAQLTAEIQPRVFDESFPNKIIYVGDVLTGQPVHWRNLFMADLTPPSERKNDNGQERGEGPVLTIASESLVVPDTVGNRLQLSLRNGSTYEAAKDPQDYYKVSFPVGEQALEARARGEVRAKNYTATPTMELMGEIGKSLEARIEFHQRLALPLACLLLALTGIPLGVSSRKGGRSAAFVITVVFAFFYFTMLVSLISLAREGKMPAELAVWMPNGLFAVAAFVLLLRLERPGDRDIFDSIRAFVVERFKALASLREGPVKETSSSQRSSRTRLFLLPQVIDTYVVSNFLFYFAMLLFCFVMLTEIFNFFELLGDVFKNNIAISELFRYLFFLAPKLLYDAAPVSVLFAVLVTFGVMAKANEIIAMKACGVSLYRLSAPVLVTCLALSGVLFAFDHYVVTNANLIQDMLRNHIKGKPVQTYLSPNRKWIFGHASRIYYYKYLNENEHILGGVSVYELDPASYRLRRHIFAERALWEPSLNTWIFQNGWVRDIRPHDDAYRGFQGGTATFTELDESPAWFLKEVKTYKQMNYGQLSAYIAELQQSGFNTTPLQVQYHKKFSVPLFALVMALLSVPFAFLTGNRGAMTGVGISIGVAIAYFAMSYFFEQLGNVGQLPPEIAAWSPDAGFALAGIYLMTRMKT
ncbi:LptF/LptG family permease [uncultured Paludibaculum sp.]|uniref:LptF/LptG family permease n=1 Tax=uncultured Paludibaculum sp. TaxID=1765020 RepID=UPI002AAC2660|nr:LptF/LptG family permease [uncultured Paludibaculum sp.]